MSSENHDHDTKSDRQIIQIAVAGADRVLALCDDGSVWWTVMGKADWIRFPDIRPPPEEQLPFARERLWIEAGYDRRWNGKEHVLVYDPRPPMRHPPGNADEDKRFQSRRGRS